MKKLSILGFLALAGCASAGDDDPGTLAARARFIDAGGQAAGEALLYSVADGIRVVATLPEIPAGEHGFHFHAVGTCQPPKFESARGHFNPTNKQHGRFNPNGPHLGDLPNAGSTTVNFVIPGVQLSGPNGLLDSDGAALVLHANADDMRTDPSGNSGERIRCAVVERP